MTREERLVWALNNCRRMQWRMTPVRRAILTFLAGRRTPGTLELIARAEGVCDCCDATTVYRTLMMFKEAELVRLVSTPHKNSYFVLNIPGDSANFLICQSCGKIVELTLPQDIVERICRISAGHGFVPAPQNYEVHGLCQRCQPLHQSKVIPTKLIS